MAGNTTKNTVIIIALMLALFTGILTYRFLDQYKRDNEQKLIPVVLATQEILPRAIVEPAMITVRPRPASQVPEKYFRNEEEVIGKVALATIPANTVISGDDIEAKGVGLGLAYGIPQGMRAVTVGVDQIIGVAGFLKPGDHVDIVATFNRGEQSVAKTVLQDVQLLALGSQLEKERLKKEGGDKPNQPSSTWGKDTATLLVTPQEAERVVLAENEGKLRLVLRAVGDVLRVDSRGTTSQSVTGNAPTRIATTVSVRPSPAPRYPPPPKYFWDQYGNRALPIRPLTVKAIPKLGQPADIGHKIEVIRGTTVETVKVEENAKTSKEVQ